MTQSTDSPLIVTLKLDPLTFEQVNTLRQQNFPPERNLIPAHITLFHALPGEQISSITGELQQICAQTSCFQIHFPSLRFLGKGVAIECLSPSLNQLQQELAQSWTNWLTAQDRQRYQPHITIQNKVLPEQAHQLYDQMEKEWHPLNGQGEGLLLWHYRGGPWELAEEFSFIDKSLDEM
jgi:2'-5' RNA ligase